MKIKTLALNNFRGFPGPDPTVFNFEGKNVLVYGENGSGKSSIFHALRAFFSTAPATFPKSLGSEQGRNQYTGEAGCSISIRFEDNAPPLVWDLESAQSIREDNRVIEAALRRSCLDYKSLLRTNFMHGGGPINLFDIVVGTILADYPVITTDGRRRRLISLYADVECAIPYAAHERRPDLPEIVGKFTSRKVSYKSHTQAALDEIERARLEFNKGLRDALDALLSVVNSILGRLPVEGLEIEGFTFSGIEYDQRNKKYTGTHIEPIVRLSTYTPPRPQDFLNEARLSAFALALYLAGRHHVVPADTDYTANGLAVPLKLLVLDDVLVGLDMTNRGAVLDILRDMFSEWQIVLLTHDYVWYEMVRMGAESDDWRVYELYCGKDIDGGFDRPVVKEYGTGWTHLLTVADNHLANHDARAAAVYARAAFEGWVKNTAEGKGVSIRYYKDQNRLSSDTLWKAVVEKYKDAAGIIPSAKRALISNLELARKIVLNPWSHGAGSPVVEIEVRAAIDAVRALAGL